MLYIMRHGKTQWNKEQKLQGQIDIPLIEEGRQVAIAAREKNKDLHFDVCYASPLLRAKETAELFLEGTDTPIIFDDRLKEMSFGEYEGSLGYFDDPKNPVNVLFVRPEAYVPTGSAESLENLSERSKSFLDEIVYPQVKEDPRKNILIVAHGALGCSLISHIKKTPLEHFWDNLIGNCELVRLL